MIRNRQTKAFRPINGKNGDKGVLTMKPVEPVEWLDTVCACLCACVSMCQRWGLIKKNGFCDYIERLVLLPRDVRVLHQVQCGLLPP